MNNDKIKSMMEDTVDKIKAMASVDTVFGDPIQLDENTKVIPVSKISYGFASGGSDIPTKTEKEVFGGGGGAGVTVTPVAFLVMQNGYVKLLNIDRNVTALDKAFDIIPTVFDRTVSLIDNIREEKKADKSE